MRRQFLTFFVALLLSLVSAGFGSNAIAKKLDPIDVEILKKVKLEAVEKKTWKIGKHNIRPYAKTAQREFKKALKFQKRDKFDKAIAKYKKSVEIEPKFYESWFNLGLCYEKKKQDKKAIHAFEKVKRSISQYGPMPNRHLALLYLKKNTYNLDMAQVNYEQSLSW